MVERHAIDLLNSRGRWLALREHDLTASVIGCLLGVHEYTTVLDQWTFKTGRSKPDKEQTEAMERGELLEPVAAELLRRRNPDWIIKYPVGEYYRDAESRIGATPDIIATDPKRKGFGVIQTKSVEASIFRRKWETDNGAEPPLWIVVQALVEARLTGASWAAVAPLVVSHGLSMPLIEIPLHAELWQTLQAKAQEFWEMVAVDRMPPADYGRDGAALSRMFSPVGGEVIDLSGDNTLPALRADDLALSGEIKAKESRRKEIKVELLSKMKTAEVAMYNGEVFATAKLIKRKAHEVAASSYRNVAFKGGKDE